MGLLASKYRALQPTFEYLTDKVVLAQAWKKAHQYIRSTNWYADNFELDRSALDLDERLNHWIAELKSPEFSFDALRLVPAPKAERWAFVKAQDLNVLDMELHDWTFDASETYTHRWSPEAKKPKPLRPLAHVSIRDQCLLMALMMCLVNKVESSQGNAATPLNEVHQKKIVNYGNRLYCQFKDSDATFAWGNSTSYSKYFSDYQKFLARPLYFGAEALQQKHKGQQVFEVHLDIAKFYDNIDRNKLVSGIRDLCDNNQDPIVERLLESLVSWKWDAASPAIYEEVCKSDQENIPSGIPQGLVVGGFLANIYLLNFDEVAQALIGQDLSDKIRLVDYCRYVDDMRLILLVDDGIRSEEIRSVIDEKIGCYLLALGLKFNHDKTKVEKFIYKRSGISTKLKDIQSKVSGPLSASEVDEQLGHLEGLIGLADSLRDSQTDQDNTNPLAIIEAPSNDVRDDTLLRFSANKIHSLLKQKRSFFSQELDENGNPKPGTWDYLQERMARKFISCWSKDPSLTLLLKKGLELFPDKRILKPVLGQLMSVAQREAEVHQQQVAQYCLGEIFRHAATVIHTKHKWTFPAHADTNGFFEHLQNLAVNIISSSSAHKNLIDQAMFYCLVRNDSPLDQDTSSDDFNVITKMMKGYRNISAKMSAADFVANALLSYQLSCDKGLVVRAVSCLLEKAFAKVFPLPAGSLCRLDVKIFCKKIAVESPAILSALADYAKNNDCRWISECKDVMEKAGLFQLAITGDLNRFNGKPISLLGVVKRSDNPFAHENSALALLQALLSGGDFDCELDSLTEYSLDLISNIDLGKCTITCSNWGKIQSLDVRFSIVIDFDEDPIFPLPEWIEENHKPLYRLGIFLRSCLMGNVDWSSMSSADSSQARYIGLRSSFVKRQLGMMHSPEALNGETAPMSNWVSSLLFALLQWPGTNLHEGNYEWPKIWDIKSLQKLTIERLRYQKKLFCTMTGIPAYVERFSFDWQKDKKSLKVVMVQSLLPLKGDFQEHGLMLDTPKYRSRHRRHIASVAELILHKAHSQRSIDDLNYKDSSIDLIIWPELSVSEQDTDILHQLANKTGAMIFTGLTFMKLHGVEGPNNLAKWLIPQKLSAGKKFISRLQGKFNMMKDEVGKVKPWRPYQLLIELVHPAFPKDKGFTLSGSVCYDATDIKISADLKDKSDAYLVVALNQDVTTFDSMVDALYYHMYQHVALVNTGEFGGSVAKAPYKERYDKLITHVHGSNQVSISSFEMNMFDFRSVGSSYRSGKKVKTKPAG